MKLENIKKVLENYKLGSLKDCKKISHGFANLNFKITTANGNFLFRINKHQELSTIQYELRVLNELKKINFPTKGSIATLKARAEKGSPSSAFLVSLFSGSLGSNP